MNRLSQSWLVASLRLIGRCAHFNVQLLHLGYTLKNVFDRLEMYCVVCKPFFRYDNNNNLLKACFKMAWLLLKRILL